MQSFFHPTDIRMFDAVVTHVTIHGSAFCALPNNEKVFIPGKLADEIKVRVGDFVKVYAVGNHPDHTDSAKYRAIRAIVDTRLEDFSKPTVTHEPYPAKPSVPVPPVKPEPAPDDRPEPMAQPDTESDELTQEQLYTLVRERLKQRKVWTARGMYAAIFPDRDDHALYLRVTHVLKYLHKKGECASARVLMQEDANRASYTYYAGQTPMFHDVLGD